MRISKYKYILRIGFFLLCGLLLASMVGFFRPAKVSAASTAEGFHTRDYRTEITVSEDNVYTIQETITVEFYHENKHGIFRTIPLRGSMKREKDGKNVTVSYFATIGNIQANVPSQIEKHADYVEIRLGDANQTVPTYQKKTYQLTYHYVLANGGYDLLSEFYHNVFPANWPTEIEKGTFSVTFPKAFDPAKVQVFAGSGVNSDSSLFEYQISGNTISGQLNRKLEERGGLTLRTQFEKGYFSANSAYRLYHTILPAIFWSALALIIVIAAIFWFLFGRDKMIVKTVEFQAPDGMNPAEVGYLHDYSADTKDIVSLILYWAHKGYLEIQECGKDDFMLLQKSELPANAREYEHTVFRGLFAYGGMLRNAAISRDLQGNLVFRAASEKAEGSENAVKPQGMAVKISSLKNVFYSTVNQAKRQLTEEFREETARTNRKTKTSDILYEKKSIQMQKVAAAILVLGAMALNFLGKVMTMNSVGTGLFTSLFVGVAGLFSCTCFIGAGRQWKSGKLGVVLLAVLLSCAAGALSLVSNPIAFYWPYAAGLAAAMLVGGVIMANTGRRTQKYTEWLGKIYGFKDFLMSAEKDRINRLVERDPGYFYGILPYAYVLGVSDKWAKRFEGIALPPPNWYRGNINGFNTMIFMRSMNRCMFHLHQDMSSRPHNSGGSAFGGGSSGGGFSSGGGSGGGGGGSW